MLTDMDSARNYLNSNSSVLIAGRNLQRKLGANFEKLELAISELEQAAESQDARASSYRAFMFSALEQTEETQKEARQEISENILTTVVADLQVGSVFVAAGQAVGETRSGDADVQKGHLLLKEALDSLEATTPAVERGLSAAISARDTATLTGQRRNEAPQSASASDAFRANSEQMMSFLVSEFRDVAVSVVKALKKPLELINVMDVVMDVIEKIGGPLKTAGGIVGRLIKKGMEKIQAAVDALVNLIGNDALTKIKDRIKELWKEIGQKKLDEWANEVLGRFIGVEATRKTIDDVLGSTPNEKALSKASDEVLELMQPYKKSTEMAKTAVGAVSLISGVLFVLPVGQEMAFFAALTYFVILSAVLLIAMDYCDSGRILGRVRGVGEIANGLRA